MPVKVDLKNLSFGSPAAEREQNLSDYFVESESFLRLRDGSKNVALGNRGAGKTAIFKMLAARFQQQGTIVVEISPDEFSYELLSQVLLREQVGAWAKQSAYMAAWKYVLYVLIMKQLTQTGSRLKRGAAASLYNYIRDNHDNVDVNPIGMLVSYLKRIEGFKVGRWEAGVRSKELHKLYKLEELQPLLPHLAELLGKRSVVVLVDELDRGWDASEDAKAFVGGLFHAAMSMNLEASGLRVLLSLRKELYNTIPSLYEDAQKVRDVIEVIEWDEPSLQDLISRRIAASIPEARGLDIASTWNLVFAETLAYRKTNSFNYVVDRTLYRPREIVQFCDLVRERAVTDGLSAPLDYNAITAAEISYSEMRLKDIASEYRFQYPGLDLVFETFRGMRYNMNREDLWLHCLSITETDTPVGDAEAWCRQLDPDGLIDVLWSVGFLRAQAVGGIKARRRSGSSYLGPHQVSNLNLMSLTNFHVHPMFRSHLGLKEK